MASRARDLFNPILMYILTLHTPSLSLLSLVIAAQFTLVWSYSIRRRMSNFIWKERYFVYMCFLARLLSGDIGLMNLLNIAVSCSHFMSWREELPFRCLLFAHFMLLSVGAVLLLLFGWSSELRLGEWGGMCVLRLNIQWLIQNRVCCITITSRLDGFESAVSTRRVRFPLRLDKMKTIWNFILQKY